MLIALLFLWQVAAEWVEISQQFHRKPTRITHNRPLLTSDRVTDEGTARNRVYPNQSITADHYWNKDAIQRITNLGNVERIKIFSTERTFPNNRNKYFENNDEAEESGYKNYGHIKILDESKSNFVTRENIKNNDNVNTNSFDDLENSYEKIQPENEEKITKINEHTQETNEETSKPIRESTMENVVKFLKIVAGTISRNTRRGVNSKMRYLHNLKNTILANIEARIESAWPEGSRRARAAQGSAREHVEFPSSESTLMTLSFLTFAVFLIKLVLQVIQTYKNNSMVMTPALVAAVGRTTAAYNKQRNDD